jgi:hypothetical protein
LPFTVLLTIFVVHLPWGWWSVSSRGLTAIGGSPRTLKSALLPPEAFLYAASVTLLTRRWRDHHEF